MKRSRFLKSLAIGIGAIAVAPLIEPTPTSFLELSDTPVSYAPPDKIIRLAGGSWYYEKEHLAQKAFYQELEAKMYRL